MRAADGLLHALGSVVAPGGRRARLSILIYHRVLEAPDPLVPGTIEASAFRWQMRLLARHWRVLPLGEALRRLDEDSLPPRAAAVTFDDGYEDNVRVALPILRDNGVPACFFIAAGFLDGAMMWNDVVIESLRRASAPRIDLESIGLGRPAVDTLEQRRETLRRIVDALKYRPVAEREAAVEAVRRACRADLGGLRLMMDADEVRRLHDAGMEIGAHTVTHPILSRLSPEEARMEIAGGRERLRAIVDAPVDLFAYPNGKPGRDYGPEHVRLVRDLGFRAALSTRWGAARRDQDRFQLPRFTPWDRTPARFLLRLYRNCIGAPEAGVGAVAAV